MAMKALGLGVAIVATALAAPVLCGQGEWPKPMATIKARERIFACGAD